ncbi:hypothetical protein BC940DRAFT_314393 [Gongronella butleri]|nr:hypothetical protein BC940DRAFT_314393 [Gongronella butleri]
MAQKRVRRRKKKYTASLVPHTVASAPTPAIIHDFSVPRPDTPISGAQVTDEQFNELCNATFPSRLEDECTKAVRKASKKSTDADIATSIISQEQTKAKLRNMYPDAARLADDEDVTAERLSRLASRKASLVAQVRERWREYVNAHASRVVTDVRAREDGRQPPESASSTKKVTFTRPFIMEKALNPLLSDTQKQIIKDILWAASDNATRVMFDLSKLAEQLMIDLTLKNPSRTLNLSDIIPANAVRLQGNLHLRVNLPNMDDRLALELQVGNSPEERRRLDLLSAVHLNHLFARYFVPDTTIKKDSGWDLPSSIPLDLIKAAAGIRQVVQPMIDTFAVNITNMYAGTRIHYVLSKTIVHLLRLHLAPRREKAYYERISGTKRASKEKKSDIGKLESRIDELKTRLRQVKHQCASHKRRLTKFKQKHKDEPGWEQLKRASFELKTVKEKKALIQTLHSEIAVAKEEGDDAKKKAASSGGHHLDAGEDEYDDEDAEDPLQQVDDLLMDSKADTELNELSRKKIDAIAKQMMRVAHEQDRPDPEDDEEMAALIKDLDLGDLGLDDEELTKKHATIGAIYKLVHSLILPDVDNDEINKHVFLNFGSIYVCNHILRTIGYSRYQRSTLPAIRPSSMYAVHLFPQSLYALFCFLKGRGPEPDSDLPVLSSQAFDVATLTGQVTSVNRANAHADELFGAFFNMTGIVAALNARSNKPRLFFENRMTWSPKNGLLHVLASKVVPVVSKGDKKDDKGKGKAGAKRKHAQGKEENEGSSRSNIKTRLARADRTIKELQGLIRTEKNKAKRLRKDIKLATKSIQHSAPDRATRVMYRDAAKQELRVILAKIVQMDAKVRIERTNKAALFDETFGKVTTAKTPPSGSLDTIVGVDPGLKTFATAAVLNWQDFVHHVRNIPRFATHFNDAVANDTPSPVKALTITSKQIRHVAGTTARQFKLLARKPEHVVEMEKKLAVAATPSTMPYDARAIQLACRPALLDFYVKSKMAKKAARSKMSLKDRAYACAANAINDLPKDPSRSTVYFGDAGRGFNSRIKGSTRSSHAQFIAKLKPRVVPTNEFRTSVTCCRCLGPVVHPPRPNGRANLGVVVCLNPACVGRRHRQAAMSRDLNSATLMAIVGLYLNVCGKHPLLFQDNDLDEKFVKFLVNPSAG